MNRKSPLLAYLLAAVLAIGIAMPLAAQSPVVDATANLRVPENFRADYDYLGTWAPAADEPGQGSQELHQVYASPGTIAAYLKSGDFPDGTVLVKEVYEAASEDMTTGFVSRVSKLKGWFVMVRDSKDSHPGKALWGDGWGWSWFDAANPTETTSTDYTEGCQACHEPARATHWIYVQGYAPLQR